MKAVINPKTGIYKEITDDNYRSDQTYLEKDGFRLMTDKEVEQHLGYRPYRPKLKPEDKPVEKSEKPDNSEDKKDLKTAKNKSKTADVT